MGGLRVCGQYSRRYFKGIEVEFTRIVAVDTVHHLQSTGVTCALFPQDDPELVKGAARLGANSPRN
jgi:hypothetical protein